MLTLEFLPNTKNNAGQKILSYVYAMGILEEKVNMDGSDQGDLVKMTDKTHAQLSCMHNGIHPCNFFGYKCLLFLVRHGHNHMVKYGRIVAIEDAESLDIAYTEYLALQ